MYNGEKMSAKENKHTQNIGDNANWTSPLFPINAHPKNPIGMKLWMSWMLKNWYGAGKWLRYEENTNDKNRKDIKMIRIESNLRVTNAENTNEMYNGKIIRYDKEKRIYALKYVNMK